MRETAEIRRLSHEKTVRNHSVGDDALEEWGSGMKHLGDITKINGAEIPVVDIITGGSPCQDLSVAGKRAGLQHSDLGDKETTRSGLFMDQIRIVKEMRESDRRKGRHGVDVRPRYMVWENVPGAFSSNGGKDFQAVLTEIARIAEPDYPDVPLPEKGGWPKAGCLYGEMGNWSIAYRVHDAQYWGVPQRRKRIALLADFNGLSAPAILFDPQLRGETEDSESNEAIQDSGAVRRPEVQSFGKSLSGHSEPGGEEGQGTSESPFGRSDGTGCGERRGTGSFGHGETGNGWSGNPPAGAISFQERAGCDGGARESSSRMSEQGQSQPSETNQCSPDAISIQGNTIDRDPKQNGGGVLSERLAHAEQRGQAWSNGICPEPEERGSGLEGQNGQSCGGAGDETTDVHLCGCGLPERDGIPFCERDSASEGAGAEPQQQQRCESPEPKFFQNTGVGWWNEGNAAETIRTPGGATQPKQTLSCANPYDPQSERIYHGDGAFHSLSSNSGGGRAETPSSQAVDVYNQTIDGEIAASVTAASGGTNTSGPKVMWWGSNRGNPLKQDRSDTQRNRPLPSAPMKTTPSAGGAIGLDHVLLSGGTTFQGRGWYDEVSGCLKTMPHGVMTDETDRS